MNIFKKFIIFAFVLGLLFSVVPVHAIDNVEMTGTYSDKFELKLGENNLFDIAIMNPGDVWENSIDIKNTTGYDMEVRLFEVTNNIEDTMMFDVLQVIIEIDGEVVYEGPYNEIPASEWIKIKNGETAVVKVTLEFPGECGNEYQAKEFDSLWTFEARMDNSDIKPEEPPVQTGVARTLYISGGICIGAFILFILLKDKKDEKDKKK